MNRHVKGAQPLKWAWFALKVSEQGLFFVLIEQFAEHDTKGSMMGSHNALQRRRQSFLL